MADTVNVTTVFDPATTITISWEEYYDLLNQNLIYSVEGGVPLDRPDFTDPQYAEFATRGSDFSKAVALLFGDEDAEPTTVLASRFVPNKGGLPKVLDEFRANDATFGANSALSATDNSAAINAAIATANGRAVHIDQGRYRSKVSVTGQSVDLQAKGVLVQQAASNVIEIIQPMGPDIAFSASALQFGPNLPTSNDFDTATVTKLTMPGSDYTGYKTGDIYYLYSNDTLPFSAQAFSTPGDRILPAEFATILGVGIDVTDLANGGPLEGTSATIGSVTAVIQSQIVMDGTSAKIILSSISAPLSVGANIVVGGITVGKVGAVYLVTRGSLEYTYTTTPLMRKLDTTKTINIDVTIDTDGDMDALLSSANRLPAIRIVGGYKARIRARVKGAYTRAIQLIGCYESEVELLVDGLPNHAITAEGAFGYGVELRGATTGTRVSVSARGLRHAFTTNPFPVKAAGASSYGVADPANFGVPLDNIVHDSYALECYSAGFDTHEGCVRTIYDNCVVVSAYSGNRFNSRSVGFQNRGFDTIIRNCVAVGTVVGFAEGALGLDRGKQFTNVIENSKSLGFQSMGYREGIVDSPVSGGRMRLVNLEMVGDGRPQNAPYFQIAYNLGRSTVSKTEVVGCSARRFNGTPISIVSSSSEIDIVDDFYADYTDADLNAVGVQIQDSGVLNLLGYSFKGTGTNRPPSVLEVVSGSPTVNIDPAGVHSVNRLSNPLFRTLAGTPTYNTRRYLEVDSLGIAGDADLVITRGSSKVQIFAATLTANRTVTLPTTLGVAVRGQAHRITRSAGGAFTLTVGSTGKVLATGQWCEVAYTGSTWVVTASGIL